jgi:hypothetical protein
MRRRPLPARARARAGRPGSRRIPDSPCSGPRSRRYRMSSRADPRGDRQACCRTRTRRAAGWHPRPRAGSRSIANRAKCTVRLRVKSMCGRAAPAAAVRPRMSSPMARSTSRSASASPSRTGMRTVRLRGIRTRYHGRSAAAARGASQWVAAVAASPDCRSRVSPDPAIVAGRFACRPLWGPPSAHVGPPSGGPTGSAVRSPPV